MHHPASVYRRSRVRRSLKTCTYALVLCRQVSSRYFILEQTSGCDCSVSLYGNWLWGGGHETAVVGAAFIGRVGEERCLGFG